MARPDLLDELARRVLVCDGAMGTQLMARGLAAGSCGEVWNVERPGDVRAIHAAYVAAGCHLITTNTFGGSAPALERHHAADRADSLNQAGAQRAREAAGDRAWVLGDVGPFGGFLEPVGDMPAAALLDVFRRQTAALLEGGADGIIIETMADPAEVDVAVRADRAAGSRAVLATYAFQHGQTAGEFRTMMGSSVTEAVRRAINAGADVVGANCGTSLSLDDYVVLAGQLVAAAGATPVIAQPNAGSPQVVDGRLVHPATPADMAAFVPRVLDAGVRIVGGCCGTTPEHLRAMAAAVRR